MGEALKFNLSLALFSSFEIDAGTKLLLKTIAQKKLISGKENILDAGCGVGTIGISIKKRFPKTLITAVDRDMLAVKFTKDNAILNKIIKGFSAKSGLLPGSLKVPASGITEKYDLIFSNIPAKAGSPVIKDFFLNCGLHLNEGGITAVVIVKKLYDFAKNCLVESKAKIIFEESDKNYSVFHFISAQHNQNRSFDDIYKRTAGTISGFYGLPEFDTISYSTKTALEILDFYKPEDNTLFWNPGTGHVAVKCENHEKTILASYDLLQLKATEYNIKTSCKILHLPMFKTIKNHVSEIDTIIAVPRFISRGLVEKEIIDTSLDVLKTGGKLIVSGKSSDIARIEKERKTFIIRNSIKYRGFRTIILEKK